MLTIAPPSPALAHRPDRRLHQEERRAGVDVEEPRPDVERRRRGTRRGRSAPAALTSTSIRPKRSRHSPTSRAGASGSARSAATKAAGAPASASCVGDGARRGPRRGRSAAGRRRRRAPSASAMARPTPCVAPVTSATLPSTRASTALLRNEVSIFCNMERNFPPVNRAGSRRATTPCTSAMPTASDAASERKPAKSDSITSTQVSESLHQRAEGAVGDRDDPGVALARHGDEVGRDRIVGAEAHRQHRVAPCRRSRPGRARSSRHCRRARCARPAATASARGRW